MSRIFGKVNGWRTGLYREVKSLSQIGLSKRVYANQKQGASWTDAMTSITKFCIVQMQGSSNKVHHQVGNVLKFSSVLSSQIKRNKTSQTKDVTLTIKTKDNRRVWTTINKMEMTKNKVDLTAVLHTWATWKKLVFTLSQGTRTTTTINSGITFTAMWPNSRQRLRNKTTILATNRNFLGSDRRCSCRRYWWDFSINISAIIPTQCWTVAVTTHKKKQKIGYALQFNNQRYYPTFSFILLWTLSLNRRCHEDWNRSFLQHFVRNSNGGVFSADISNWNLNQICRDHSRLQW